MKTPKKPIKRNVKNQNNNKNNITPKDKNKEVDPINELACRIDRDFRKALASITGPVDFPSFMRAFYDYYVHVAFSPGTMYKIQTKYNEFLQKLFKSMLSPAKQEELNDRRFKNYFWDVWPFNVLRDGFIAYEDFLEQTTKNIKGVSEHNDDLLEFSMKQHKEIFNPLNNPVTNPEVINKTIEQGGQNLVRGFLRFIDNFIKNQGKVQIRHSVEDAFQVGKTLAITPGKVVFRNDLIELIQYTPKTKQQRKVPTLIVPAWINKYYVLDLRPQNSMVKWILEQGHQVYMISWKNPDSSYRNYGLEDYMKKGVIEAVSSVKNITGVPAINLAGYCMGSIITTITAAYLGGLEDNSINSLTYFAGQIDFSDAGEIRAFIDESQISFLQDLMEDKGYLDKENMAQTFSLLRARELFYNYAIKEFVLGEDPYALDFLFWNDDSTRMPEKLHIDILKKLYLEDQMTEGKFRIDGGKSIDLRDITADMYSLATIRDHIAPWKSVYRIPHWVSSPMKFVLASSGHIAGVVNPPGDGRSYYYVDGVLGKGPENWKNTAEKKSGSWWIDWIAWLDERSGEKIPAYSFNKQGKYKPICDAPGTYVFEK